MDRVAGALLDLHVPGILERVETSCPQGVPAPE
jgi:hypothetical protein